MSTVSQVWDLGGPTVAVNSPGDMEVTRRLRDIGAWILSQGEAGG